MTADTQAQGDLMLSHELQGVIADVKHGNGFDAVCLETIERVAAALQGRAQEGEPSDTERLDWIVRQADEFACFVIVDAPGDGDYMVFGMGEGAIGQGKTAREAIDRAALAQESRVSVEIREAK